MQNEILNKVKSFVDDSFGSRQPHFEQTVYWVLKLKPEADLAMQIAAYSHDIQRAFAMDESLKAVEKTKDGFKDAEFLRGHQEEGGQIMYDFLIKEGQSNQLAESVKDLIAKHEVGGTDDQNTLKDADSLSYFECNADHFVTKFAPVLGAEKVRAKFDWMYERISGIEARNLAKPMYNEAIEKLNNFPQSY